MISSPPSEHAADAEAAALAAWWQRMARHLDSKDRDYASRLHEKLLERAAALIASARIGEPAGLLPRWETLRAIWSDPRCSALREQFPGAFATFLQAQGERGPDAWPLAFEAFVIHGGPAAQRDARRAQAQAALVPDEARRAAISQRSERLCADPAFAAPVLICGFHHSGTRLLARMLAEIGVFQQVHTAEHEWALVQYLDSVLQPAWLDARAPPADPAAAAAVIDVPLLAFRLAAAGYMGRAPWGLKDPRLCLTAGAWRSVFPAARLVHIVRDPVDAVGTLSRRYARFSPAGAAPQDDAAFWAPLWTAYLRQARAALAATPRAIEVRFEDLCRQPVATVGAIIRELELDCDVRETDFRDLGIDPGRAGAHREWAAQGRLPAAAIALLALVREQAGVAAA